MNERIRELELEAIAYADSKVPANDRYNDIYHSIVRRMLVELIVRECMKVVRDINQEYDGGSTVVNAADEIAEHFGVEE
jgi:hypothetical protein